MSFPEFEDGLRSHQYYQGAPCGLVLLDGKGRFLDANAAFVAWFDYRADELVGHRRFHDLLTGGSRIFFQTHIGPLLAMQGSVEEIKLDIRHKDGRSLPVLANVVDHGDGEARVRQVSVFIAKDRLLYERELMLARQQAEALLVQQADAQQKLMVTQALAEDRALFAEQMMAIVSHDLRTPLSVLLLGADSLQRDVLNERQERVLEQMRTAVHRANRLISDLLDFTEARVGQGIRVRPKRIDVHACTAGALAELRVALPNHTLIHRAEGPSEHNADPDRVVQLIGNLVSNAAAYGDSLSPITVSSVGQPESFFISVHNEGAQIPASLIDSIFEPMTRGGNGTEGIGLGLFIVRRIVEAHGGRAEISSTASGTEFRAYFVDG